MRFRRKIYSTNGTHLLTRYYLTPRLWGYRLMLHVFHHGDQDRDPHDHPYDFWTMPLRSYREVPYDGALTRGWVRWVRAFRIHRRPAEYVHRVIDRPDGRPWATLVWRGPRRREWGFHTPGAWIPWQTYHEEG